MQHPAREGPHSASSAIEAMKSAQSAAITSNEKIFPVFAKKFASGDLEEYVHMAQKLASWLNNEKAYYPAARPRIIELLEVALSVFMDTHMRNTANTQPAEHLRRLIQTVLPFRELFPDRQLQSRLHRVILDAELSLTRFSTNVARDTAPVTPNVPPPPVTSPVHPQPLVPPPPGPEAEVPTWHLQPSSSVPVAEQAIADNTLRMDSPRAPNASEVVSPVKIEAVPSHAPPVTSTSQDLNANTTPVIPSKPQPKRARRAELSEELVARDLDWFKSNHALTVVHDNSSAPGLSPKVGEPSPAPSDPSQVHGTSPSPKKKTARMVPSRRLPRRISSDGTQEAGSGASASPLPHASEPSAENAQYAEDISVKEDVGPAALAAAISSAFRTRDDSRHEALPPPEPQPMNASSNGTIQPDIPQADHNSPSAEVPPLNGNAHPSADPPTPPPETSFEGMEAIDIPTSDPGPENLLSESPMKPELISPPSPEEFRLPDPVLPPLVNTLEPPLDLNFSILQTSAEKPQESDMRGQQRFGGVMTIIHSTRGKPFTHTHTIDIELNEGVFTKISMWVNRKVQPSDAPHGVCISLACYRLEQFFDTLKQEGDKHDMQGLTFQSSCSWPSSKQLSLRVNDDASKTVITLSPPLFLTPDQCVDISSLMKPGSNSLEMKQEDDLSEYLVVLHAHRPTRAQLAELDVIKAADERWKRFLDAFAGRIAVPETVGVHGASPGLQEIRVSDAL